MLEIMVGLENDHWKRLIVRFLEHSKLGWTFLKKKERGEREIGRQAHHSN